MPILCAYVCLWTIRLIVWVLGTGFSHPLPLSIKAVQMSEWTMTSLLGQVYEKVKMRMRLKIRCLTHKAGRHGHTNTQAQPPCWEWLGVLLWTIDRVNKGTQRHPDTKARSLPPSPFPPPYFLFLSILYTISSHYFFFDWNCSFAPTFQTILFVVPDPACSMYLSFFSSPSSLSLSLSLAYTLSPLWCSCLL